MFEWILVITMWAGSTSGGVAVSTIDSMTLGSCEVARKKLLAEAYPEDWRKVSRITATCIKRLP